MTQERELEAGLNDGELSRLYAEVPGVEPPEHLDVAILAEAHRAVSARPAGRPKRRWAVPLGLVASLFAMVMIGLQLPYMLKESAPTAIAPRMEEPAAAEPAPAQQVRREMRSADKSANEIAGSKPVAPPAEAPMSAPALMAAPAMAAKQLEVREREERVSVGALAKEKKSAYMEGIGTSDALKRQAPAAAAAAPPVILERALMKDEADTPVLRPEEWLKRIEKLKQEGKQEEARKELEAFRKRYPGYPVPAGVDKRD